MMKTLSIIHAYYAHAGELAHDNGGSEFTWERDHEGRARLWKARHEWMYAGLALKPGMKVLATSQECSVLPKHNLSIKYIDRRATFSVETVTTAKLVDYIFSHFKRKYVQY